MQINSIQQYQKAFSGLKNYFLAKNRTNPYAPITVRDIAAAYPDLTKESRELADLLLYNENGSYLYYNKLNKIRSYNTAYNTDNSHLSITDLEEACLEFAKGEFKPVLKDLTRQLLSGFNKICRDTRDFNQHVFYDYSMDINVRKGSIKSAHADTINDYRINRYYIPSAKLAPGDTVRVCAMSDLEKGRSPILTPANIDTLRLTVNKYKPDIILISGDICDDNNPGSHLDALGFKAAIDKFSVPAYASLGNNDLSYRDLNKIYDDRITENDIDKINAYGFHTLYNQSVDIGKQVTVTGLDYYCYAGYTRQLDVLNALDKNKLNLIIIHDPSRLDEVHYNYQNANPGTIDMAFAGHFHSGQINIGLVNGMEVRAGHFRLFGGYANGLLSWIAKTAFHTTPDYDECVYRNFHPHIVGLDQAWGVPDAFPLHISTGIVNRTERFGVEKKGFSMFYFYSSKK